MVGGSAKRGGKIGGKSMNARIGGRVWIHSGIEAEIEYAPRRRRLQSGVVVISIGGNLPANHSGRNIVIGPRRGKANKHR